MRRSGSSSCLLKPKKSLSQHDLAQLNPPSATVLTVNRLPVYVTDRLYMLSELQVHAHSIQFLCDLKNESKTHSLPPSIILYMRWLPGTTYQTPLSFADGPLSECVRQCLLANGDDAPLGELQLVRSHPREPPYSPRRQHFEELSAQSAECLKKKSPPLGLSSVDSGSPISISSIEAKRPGENNQLTNIYVVVDRISPDTSSNDLPNPPDLCYTSYKSIQKGEQIEPSSQTISSTIQPIQYELFMQQSQSKFYSAEQKESNHHQGFDKFSLHHPSIYTPSLHKDFS